MCMWSCSLYQVLEIICLQFNSSSLSLSLTKCKWGEFVSLSAYTQKVPDISLAFYCTIVPNRSLMLWVNESWLNPSSRAQVSLYLAFRGRSTDKWVFWSFSKWVADFLVASSCFIVYLFAIAINFWPSDLLLLIFECKIAKSSKK